MVSSYELQNILSGACESSKSNFIQAAASILRTSAQAGGDAQKRKQSKGKEESKLIDWIEENSYWYENIIESRYLTRGAEQRVYLDEDPNYVIKLNDSIFYECWLDYFHSLLMHNYFFPNTAYELKGFYLENGILYAVVQQPFIKITQSTDLFFVRTFLQSNGFHIVRNNDYVNDELGIILEDIHDENVLINNGVLFFIDTVFYLK